MTVGKAGTWPAAKHPIFEGIWLQLGVWFSRRTVAARRMAVEERLAPVVHCAAEVPPLVEALITFALHGENLLYWLPLVSRPSHSDLADG